MKSRHIFGLGALTLTLATLEGVERDLRGVITHGPLTPPVLERYTVAHAACQEELDRRYAGMEAA